MMIEFFARVFVFIVLMVLAGWGAYSVFTLIDAIIQHFKLRSWILLIGDFGLIWVTFTAICFVVWINQ
jgi:hypothetical protein